MDLQVTLISGCMLGLEFVTSSELNEDERALYLVVDLLIFRILFVFE